MTDTANILRVRVAYVIVTRGCHFFVNVAQKIGSTYLRENDKRRGKKEIDDRELNALGM